MLPLGGFVRLLGEEDPSDPRSLAAKAAWKRIIVLASGALMNVILPVALYAAFFMVPQDTPIERVTIDKVNPGSPAEAAGLKTGDILLRVNGHDVENVYDAQRFIALGQGTTMNWDIRRPAIGGGAGVSAGSENLTVHPYGRWVRPPGQGFTGVSLAHNVLQTETRSYPLWEAVPMGVRWTAESLVLARNQIISWVKARTAPEVSGPIGIAQATGEVVKQSGWVALLNLAALLSINLAVINLLPLPMLDGGRIMFVLVEILRGGKRVPPEKEALVHLAGFVLLLGLVVVVSYVDILRIVNGENPLK